MPMIQGQWLNCFLSSIHREHSQKKMNCPIFSKCVKKSQIYGLVVSFPHPYRSEGSTYWLGNELPNTCRPSQPTGTYRWNGINQLATVPVPAPPAPTGPLVPLKSPNQVFLRMPTRGTYKSPQGVWQPVTPSAISSFPRQLPLVSPGRNCSAASAAGAPHECTNGQIQPAEPVPPGRRASRLGSQVPQMHKRNAWINTPLSLASSCPVALNIPAPN